MRFDSIVYTQQTSGEGLKLWTPFFIYFLLEFTYSYCPVRKTAHIPNTQSTLLIPKKRKQAKQQSKPEGLGEPEYILRNVPNLPNVQTRRGAIGRGQRRRRAGHRLFGLSKLYQVRQQRQ